MSDLKDNELPQDASDKPEENNSNKLTEAERRNRIRKNFFTAIEDDEDSKMKSGKLEGHGLLMTILIGFLNVLIIVGAVILIRTFVVSPFSVVGSSMESNFANGDLILVEKLSYRFGEPERGDVIVFHPPVEKYTRQNNLLCSGKKILLSLLGRETDDACRVSDYFVKRVIGIPGDTVEIHNRQVYVTPPGGVRTKIREDFLDSKNQDRTCFSQNCNSTRDTNGAFFEVPEETVFVLGDNRTGSSDSRAWEIGGKQVPFASYDEISGKVQLIFYPLTNMTIVPDIDILETPSSNTSKAATLLKAS